MDPSDIVLIRTLVQAIRGDVVAYQCHFRCKLNFCEYNFRLEIIFPNSNMLQELVLSRAFVFVVCAVRS